MRATSSPTLDLERLNRLVFDYDNEDDLVVIHIDHPRPAVSEEVGSGWYLRVQDNSIVGLELHGLRRLLMSTPFYAQLFQPALAEMHGATGRSFEDQDLRAEGTSEELPRTSQLVTFLLGQALEKFAARRRSSFNRGRQAPVPAP